MIISLSQVKNYLRVDFDDDDKTIRKCIQAAETLVADTLRTELEITPLNKVAVLYAVAYLYEHRESANMKELTQNLRLILSTEREAAF